MQKLCEVDVTDATKRHLAPLHLALATPMHAGECSGVYLSSVLQLERALRKDGGRLAHLKLGNESHIQRARNTLTWHFLDIVANDPEPPSHLLWCDGDQGFRVPDLARMVAADKDVIVAPVPMKGIDWASVHAAALAGVPPSGLHRHAAMFNIVLEDGVPVSPHKPFRLKRGGTGFMLIKAEVFEILACSGIVETYKSDCPGDAMPLGTRVHNFFPSPVEEDHLLTEDFGFCSLWKKIGGEIHAAPWCEMQHVGAYTFTGCYADKVWASAKADGLLNEDGTLKVQQANGGENGLRAQSERERASDAA